MLSPGARLKRLAASALLTLVLGVLAVEVTLRVRGSFLTYSEVNFGEYRSNYGKSLDSWVYDRGRDVEFTYRTSEFSFVYRCNADGVRDRVHAQAKPPGVFRVVVLGDSYVEGLGAEREEAMPARLESYLLASGHNVEVFNAGVAASDPFFELRLLEERFLAYRPDLVIATLNSTDIEDVMAWGGMERFQPDGHTRSRPAPRFEPLYARSHLVRWITHRLLELDHRFHPIRGVFRDRLEAQLVLVEALEGMRELAEREGFELWVLLFPTPSQVGDAPPVFYWQFRAALDERGIAWHDLFGALSGRMAELERESYCWPVDLHYTALGYDLFARFSAEALIASDLLPVEGPR